MVGGGVVGSRVTGVCDVGAGVAGVGIEGARRVGRWCCRR